MNPGVGEVGVLTTDRALVVRSWDGWLEDVTGIPAEAALGQPLASLFPDVEARGLLPRLRRVADEGVVEVLAPAFHQYLIPCPPRGTAGHFARMQQHVTLSPLREGDGIVGVMATLRDVTARREGERRIAERLRSADEATRLEAVEALAAAEASPDILVGAFADASWRVRQAGVEAVAHHRGDGVVEVLTGVLREHHRDPAVLNATLSALAASGEDVLPSLLELLASEDTDLRVYVALALGLRGDLRAAPALERALGDPDPNVRFHALEALGRLRARSAAPAIAAVAESRDFSVAFAALDALAAIGDETAAPRILPLLEDEMLRSAALGALGSLGGEEAVAALAGLLEREDVPAEEPAGALAAIYCRYQDGFGDGEVIAGLAGATIGEAGGRRLAAALADARPADVPALARVLGWLRTEGVPEALVQALSHPDARAVAVDALVRQGSGAAGALAGSLPSLGEDALRAAVTALGRIGSPAAVPALLAVLESVPETAVAVAGALGAIGDRRAYEPLLPLLDHPGAAVRHAAIGALGSIGHADLRDHVCELLESPSPVVRESAARIAGYLGYEECVEPFLALCRDADEGVRRAAVEHLVYLDDPRVPGVLRDVLRDDTAPCRAAAARALARLASDEAGELLSVALADRDLWVRYYAARSAGAAGAAELAAGLAGLARHDPVVPVRIAALQALGEVGGPEAAEVLAALAEDPEPEIRLAALGALGGAAHPAALRALGTALRSEAPDARRMALEGLGSDAAAALAEEVAAAARTAAEPAVARAAAFALLRAASPESVRLLCGLAAAPPLRETCVEALARLPGERLDLLADALRGGSPEVRGAVLAALGHRDDAGAERLAATAADDPDPGVRRAAALALARLDLRAAGGAGHA
jgi:HEAT repeat protein